MAHRFGRALPCENPVAEDSNSRRHVPTGNRHTSASVSVMSAVGWKEGDPMSRPLACAAAVAVLLLAGCGTRGGPGLASASRWESPLAGRGGLTTTI